MIYHLLEDWNVQVFSSKENAFVLFIWGLISICFVCYFTRLPLLMYICFRIESSLWIKFSEFWFHCGNLQKFPITDQEFSIYWKNFLREKLKAQYILARFSHTSFFKSYPITEMVSLWIIWIVKWHASPLLCNCMKFHRKFYFLEHGTQLQQILVNPFLT